MKITFIAVGRLKEKYFSLAVEEYSKRLSKYANFEIIEVADEKAPENLSLAEEDIIRLKEGQKILKQIKSGGYVVATAINGKQPDSEGLSKFIEKLGVDGVSHIYFIIGGSLGLSREVLERADYLLSFSKMTFPHQLMRVMLAEQVYRGFRIISGEPYHK